MLFSCLYGIVYTLKNNPNLLYMKAEQQLQVARALMRYVARMGAVSQAASTLSNISPEVINAVIGNKWSLLHNDIWHNLATQVGFYSGEWKVAETDTMLLLRCLFNDARYHAHTYGIAMCTGAGKTITAQHYRDNDPNIIYVVGNAHDNRLGFMWALCEAAHLNPTTNIQEMSRTFTAHIRNCHAPLLVIDNVHVLKDRVLHLVTDLFGSLVGICGLVVMGDTSLPNRVGLLTPHHRLHALIGQSFVTQHTIPAADTYTIAHTNYKGLKNLPQMPLRNEQKGIAA